jgi:hypothetical protein
VHCELPAVVHVSDDVQWLTLVHATQASAVPD